MVKPLTPLERIYGQPQGELLANCRVKLLERNATIAELEAKLSREIELREQADAATERMRHKLLAVKEIVYKIETT